MPTFAASTVVLVVPVRYSMRWLALGVALAPESSDVKPLPTVGAVVLLRFSTRPMTMSAVVGVASSVALTVVAVVALALLPIEAVTIGVDESCPVISKTTIFWMVGAAARVIVTVPAVGLPGATA